MSLPVLFNPTEWQDWRAWADAHVADLIGIAIFILILYLMVRWFISRVFRAFLTSRPGGLRQQGPAAAERRADTLLRVIRWFGTAFVGFVALVLVLDEFDRNVTAIIAGAGVIGIGIGLASQQLIRDFINGMIVLIEDQYAVGDIVQLSSAWGEVIDVSPRRTLLRDLDGNVHVVPHGLIEVTTNYTWGFSRINFNVLFAYEEDIDRVIAVINDECRRFAEDNTDDVLSPPSVFRIDNLAPDGVEAKILGDVRAGEQMRLMGELRRRMRVRFAREGIEIPYPQRALVSKDRQGPMLPPPEREASPARED